MTIKWLKEKRDSLMNEYNEVMDKYIADNNIPDNEIDKIHDKVLEKSESLFKTKIVFIRNDLRHIRKLLNIYEELKSDDVDNFRYAVFLIYMIGEMDNIINNTDGKDVENVIGFLGV